MYKTIRCPNAKIALETGIELDQTWARDWLTGLNFIVEPGGSVIIHAVWSEQHPYPDQGIVEYIMRRGSKVTAPPEELFEMYVPGRVYFLGDGLHGYKLFLLTRPDLLGD